MKLDLKKTFLLFILLLGTTSGWAQVTIGSEKVPLDGILLDLKEFDTNAANAEKGVLLPRINLQSLNSLKPLSSTESATEKLQYKGTVVYNVTTSANFREGFYYWNGVKWDALLTDMPKNSIQTINLTGSPDIANGNEKGDGGTILFENIKIPEDGAYAFTFRLYGIMNFISGYNFARCVYYISLWEGTTLKDIAEINFFAEYRGANASYYSYAITLGGQFEKGKSVTVKLARPMASGTAPYWKLSGSSSSEKTANLTSMVWWKL